MPRTVSSAEVGVGAGEHAVLFYERDSDLAETVAGYLAGVLRAWGVAIVIATEGHRRAFGRELAAAGVDLAAGGEQAVVWLDAGEVLARFMPAGGIDAEAFDREVGAVVTKAAATGRPVCVYGEMVQLLWDGGQVVAALELERLWNELIAEQRCSLMCAYRSSSVSGVEHAEALQRVCELHSSVLHAPAGGVVPSGDGRSLGAEVLADFLPEPKAPRDARRFVTDTLRRKGHDAGLINDAQLVVSELATNAVIHACSAFSVGVRSSHRAARLSVRDASRRRPVIPDRASETGRGGRGLRLVAALAADWGVEAATTGKTVWAELEPRASHAPVRVVPTIFAADPPVPGRSTPRNGREWRSELSALYRQVADTLERSAELAERHAGQEQQRGPGHQRAAEVERQRAQRAREAVRRARALASRMG